MSLPCFIELNMALRAFIDEMGDRVIYAVFHHPCPDGMAALILCKESGLNIVPVPYTHGSTDPAVKTLVDANPKTIWFLDVVPSKADFARILEGCKNLNSLSLVVLDHHLPSMDKLRPALDDAKSNVGNVNVFEPLVDANGKCLEAGVGVIWRYLHTLGGVKPPPLPHLLKAINDADLFRFENPEVFQLTFGIDKLFTGGKGFKGPMSLEEATVAMHRVVCATQEEEEECLRLGVEEELRQRKIVEKYANRAIHIPYKDAAGKLWVAHIVEIPLKKLASRGTMLLSIIAKERGWKAGPICMVGNPRKGFMGVAMRRTPGFSLPLTQFKGVKGHAAAAGTRVKLSGDVKEKNLDWKSKAEITIAAMKDIIAPNGWSNSDAASLAEEKKKDSVLSDKFFTLLEEAKKKNTQPAILEWLECFSLEYTRLTGERCPLNWSRVNSVKKLTACLMMMLDLKGFKSSSGRKSHVTIAFIGNPWGWNGEYMMRLIELVRNMRTGLVGKKSPYKLDKVVLCPPKTKKEEKQPEQLVTVKVFVPTKITDPANPVKVIILPVKPKKKKPVKTQTQFDTNTGLGQTLARLTDNLADFGPRRVLCKMGKHLHVSEAPACSGVFSGELQFVYDLCPGVKGYVAPPLAPASATDPCQGRR